MTRLPFAASAALALLLFSALLSAEAVKLSGRATGAGPLEREMKRAAPRVAVIDATGMPKLNRLSLRARLPSSPLRLRAFPPCEPRRTSLLYAMWLH
jgi:hypothetical protein